MIHEFVSKKHDRARVQGATLGVVKIEGKRRVKYTPFRGVI